MTISNSPRRSKPVFFTRRTENVSGITLLEILAALALVGVVVGLGAGQMSKMTGRNMRLEARKLASNIRYLYVKSATDNRAMRLVFDFEARKYWGEETSDLFALKSRREMADDAEADRDEKTSATEEETGTKPQQAEFSISASKFLKEQELPRGIYFKEIYAEHQLEAATEGKAYIHFFPQGYVERSIINLRDKEDELHYSLEVNPINGMVKIGNTYKEIEPDSQ